MSSYGNTETLTFSASHPSGTDPAIVAGNFGYALPGNTFKIVDPLSGEALARGETGEIAVKGPTLMVSYLRMAPDEVFDEEGFFHTGDGGFFDAEGRLHWHGRLNDIIKTGGANVSPTEIDALLRECPGVKIATTVGVAHETLGEIVVSLRRARAGRCPRRAHGARLRGATPLELQGAAARAVRAGGGSRADRLEQGEDRAAARARRASPGRRASGAPQHPGRCGSDVHVMQPTHTF